MQMIRTTLIFFLFSFTTTINGIAQTNPVVDAFPKGTVLHGNIPYNSDTLKKHLPDIYLPANAKGKVPLVVFVQGGGWLVNDKYAYIGYMKKTVAEILNNGFAIASIDYRFATQAVFPDHRKRCSTLWCNVRCR